MMMSTKRDVLAALANDERMDRNAVSIVYVFFAGFAYGDTPFQLKNNIFYG